MAAPPKTPPLSPAPAAERQVETSHPLENGDRLTREEFERRYEAMSRLKKAELIEGVVHMPSPVRLEEHGEPHMDLIGWLALYRAFTPGVRGGDNSTVRLNLDTEPQPDAVLFIDPARGGQAQIDGDGYINGAPELAVEVAASSVGIDLGPKQRVYLRNGVREYLVWRVLDRAVDWFALRQSQYAPLPLDPEGLYQSEVFPGLWLDPAALIRGDMIRVHQVLQQGLAGAEHANFVAGLQQATGLGT